MKSKPELASVFVIACASVLFSLPALAQAANPRQDQGTAQAQSGSQGKKHKAGTSPGKEVGKGGEDIGKGSARGAESLGKGTAGAAGNLATLHPVNAASDLGKGAAGAGKDVGVGAAKGTGKIAEGTGRGIGRVFHHHHEKHATPAPSEPQN